MFGGSKAVVMGGHTGLMAAERLSRQLGGRNIVVALIVVFGRYLYHFTGIIVRHRILIVTIIADGAFIVRKILSPIHN